MTVVGHWGFHLDIHALSKLRGNTNSEDNFLTILPLRTEWYVSALESTEKGQPTTKSTKIYLWWGTKHTYSWASSNIPRLRSTGCFVINALVCLRLSCRRSCSVPSPTKGNVSLDQSLISWSDQGLRTTSLRYHAVPKIPLWSPLVSSNSPTHLKYSSDSYGDHLLINMAM